MLRHVWTTITLILLVALAGGRTQTNGEEKANAPQGSQLGIHPGLYCKRVWDVLRPEARGVPAASCHCWKHTRGASLFAHVRADP